MTGRRVKVEICVGDVAYKAFDQTVDPFDALDALIALGVDGVLTSGGRTSAMDRIAALAPLVDRAENQMTIMAGGQLSAANLATVITQARVTGVHVGSAVSRMISTGPSYGAQCPCNMVDAHLVAAIVALVRGV
jgi:copper homeostasis protein